LLNTVHYEELSLWRIIFFSTLKSCIFQKNLFYKWIFEIIRKIYVWLMTVLSYKHTCSEILCCSLLEIELIVCHLLVLKNRSTRFVQHQYNKHHTPLLSQLFHFSLTPELCVKFKLFLNKLAGRENFVYFDSKIVGAVFLCNSRVFVSKQSIVIQRTRPPII